ncbi:hypothetical protein F5X68DRAFT_171819 [Plectosphaerella plurivora]|uniref:Nonselective cation channel n=1 Tax=Plectosphaerella plurivora TaxID=936078 RepID=A0A9P8V7S9_9PEZI|nr:hypothetical protein F5X68DRAFT_171819 [Plectosphaerella plurivora]
MDTHHSANFSIFDSEATTEEGLDEGDLDPEHGLLSPRRDQAEYSSEDGDDEDESAPMLSPLKGPSVYMTIHRIRRLVIASIDDPYTLQELRAPRMNMLVVRPLVDKLHNNGDGDIWAVYCLLVNRVQFLRSQHSQSMHQTVNIARATLCELVATRVLRRFHEKSPGNKGLLFLANILVSGFDPFHGAPDSVVCSGRRPQWPVQDRGGHERKLTALELAILSESKTLIASSAFQRVVSAVYEGTVVYSPLSFVDILPDHFKHHPISIYDPRSAPLLNHRRLIVPRSRNLIELFHFAILLILYIGAMVTDGHPVGKRWSIMFDLFAGGWILEQFAAIIEHGWEVHAQNLWSFLDATFIFLYACYTTLRLVEFATSSGVQYHAIRIMFTAAPVLLTRIAFTLMPDNIVFISLHAMMKDFMRLTFIALWCFTGFLLSLLWLENPLPHGMQASGQGTDGGLSWATICEWLLWIWFGLDGTGINQAPRFHPVLGPALMITFAFLGNTLFLTILVSMLTNTFSKIIADEQAEIQFRRTVLTFQAVKSDSIFFYPPPANILALALLLPLKFMASPRLFHRINVALVCTLNAPVLLLISVYERRNLRRQPKNPGRGSSLLHWRFTGFSPHGDVQSVFDSEPPEEVCEALEDLDELSDLGLSEADAIEWSGGGRRGLSRRRRAGSRESRDVFWLSNAPRGGAIDGRI